MKKILLVNGTYVGFHVFLQQLVERLHSASWEVHVATSTSNYPGDHFRDGANSFTHHEVDFPRGASLTGYRRAASQLTEVVRAVHPNIVHAHMHPAILATALARRSRRMTVLGTFQGLISPMMHGPKAWLYNRIERWAASRFQHIWVLTDGDREALPLSNVSVQSAPGFGADQTRFDPNRFDEADRHEDREAMGIPREGIVFTFLGRQTAFKGFPETAIAALQSRDRFPNAHFLFVGTPDPRHPTGLSRANHAQMEADKNIHLLGWNDDIPRLLFASDCLVFPSEREGLSVCIMEALSMGLPVITTSARGCGELIQDGHNGWIVEKDASAVAKSIADVCGQPAQLSEFAQRILAEREKFSRTHFIEEQIRNYESAVDENSASK